MKGIVSLISFSICLSFLYRRTTDFCDLILHIATLMKVFFSYKSPLVEFLGSPTYTNTLSANKDTLISSFPICILLISSSCLLSIDKISSTIFNRYTEGENPFLVPYFRGNALSFSQLGK